MQIQRSEEQYAGYLFSTDKGLISSEAVKSLLSTSYWAADRPLETIAKSIETSDCVGIFWEGSLIGFARILTDYATVYWLADVIIDENHRKKGLGKVLIEFITTHPDLQPLLGVLTTLDAHSLYEKYGFERNENFMKRQCSH